MYEQYDPSIIADLQKWTGSIAQWMKQFAQFNIFDTGGLSTGPQFAALSADGRKELVLNNTDTENILAAVALMRQTLGAKLNAAQSAFRPSTSISNLITNSHESTATD